MKDSIFLVVLIIVLFWVVGLATYVVFKPTNQYDVNRDGATNLVDLSVLAAYLNTK